LFLQSCASRVIDILRLSDSGNSVNQFQKEKDTKSANIGTKIKNNLILVEDKVFFRIL
jgi:hypothetical protein